MPYPAKIQLAAQMIAGIALLAVLPLGLLAALISGLLVYHLVEFGSNLLERVGIIPAAGKVILLILVVLSIIAGISLGIMALIAELEHGPESLGAILQRMADALDVSRNHLPVWIQTYIPANVTELQTASAEWLRQHGAQFGVLGKQAGITFVHILGGMVIGGIVALDNSAPSEAPLAKALSERMVMLGRAFTRIIFSQVRISALNAALTAIFLLIILPAAGAPLPFAKTMVLITFLVGLLPIIGNLISNTIIFVIALSVSPLTAVAALSYLIIIHKLEYFINAKIIGTRINALGHVAFNKLKIAVIF